MQLHLPAQFPARLPANPRPLLLVDVDAVSHGLAEGQERTRATNTTVSAALETAQTAARSFNADHYQVLWAASSATARCHLDLITRSANDVWAIRRGLDGADKALLEEPNDLVDARTAATRKWHAHGGARRNLSDWRSTRNGLARLRRAGFEYGRAIRPTQEGNQ